MTRWMWREAQARKARFEKAVDAHAGFVAGDGDILHGGWLSSARRALHCDGERRCRKALLFAVVLRRPWNLLDGCAALATLSWRAPLAALPRLRGSKARGARGRGSPGRGPARNRACPISNFLVPSRQQPTWWLASLAPQDDGNHADAAARPTACRRPAGEDRASRASCRRPQQARRISSRHRRPSSTVEDVLATDRQRKSAAARKRIPTRLPSSVPP